MSDALLIYGANGHTGRTIARQAIEMGLAPILAGRNAAKVNRVAEEHGLKARIFALDEPAAVDDALHTVKAVLSCAGPYLYTFRAITESCLRTRTHYLDLTGEIPVLQALAALDGKARSAEVMLLPAAGFDVVPTDCLALYLKKKLPEATRLRLAFQVDGPARLPPGTLRTALELMAVGDWSRVDGELVLRSGGPKSSHVDFGHGLVPVVEISWGDLYMAYRSTKIPNIEVYAALPEGVRRQVSFVQRMRPLIRVGAIRRMLQRLVPTGPSEADINATSTQVWGEVEDADGNTVAARLHGPEAGTRWTARAALGVVQRVLSGDFAPGFQTPATAYGESLVFDCRGVEREDIG